MATLLYELQDEAVRATGKLLKTINNYLEDDAGFRRLIQNGVAGSELEAISNALCNLVQLFADYKELSEESANV